MIDSFNKGHYLNMEISLIIMGELPTERGLCHDKFCNQESVLNEC